MTTEAVPLVHACAVLAWRRAALVDVNFTVTSGQPIQALAVEVCTVSGTSAVVLAPNDVTEIFPPVLALGSVVFWVEIMRTIVLLK